MDSQAMLAISHAIEDIAAEEGQGELISTFQDFENFKQYKARYMRLARGAGRGARVGLRQGPAEMRQGRFHPGRRGEAAQILAGAFR